MSNYKSVKGGITAPKGFMASAASAGIKNNGAFDTALIVSECSAKAAGVFNGDDKDASLLLTRKHLLDNMAKALIINSGNSSTGTQWLSKDAQAVAAAIADCLGISLWDVLTVSSGIAWTPFSAKKIGNSIEKLAQQLSSDGGENASLAILTKDSVNKQAAISLEIGNKQITIGGMAKGSLSAYNSKPEAFIVITTDAAIDGVLLQELLRNSSKACPFKAVICLANGKADNDEIMDHGYEYHQFAEAFNYLYKGLVEKIKSDVLTNSAVSEAI